VAEDYKPLVRQRARLLDVLRRHVRVEDIALSDDDFVRTVFKRYAVEREWPLLDPNE
jgi:hypothetical protein